MRKTSRWMIVLLPLLLAACGDGGVRNVLGLNKDAPDEFTTYSHPPLSVPPEFNLRPPRPGEPARAATADETARSVLTGKPVKAGAVDLDTPTTVDTAVTPVLQTEVPTGGTASLLKRAGADGAQEDIRSTLGSEAQNPKQPSKGRSLYERLSGKETSDPVVDPKKEAERLRSNKDEGKPVTEGEVPVEEQKSKSVLDRIF